MCIIAEKFGNIIHTAFSRIEKSDDSENVLQKMIAERLNFKIGWYYHHAHNMHLYNDKL